MTYARKSLISLQDTPYYHVVARCVRRAFLWGIDEYAGTDYSHRKDWVVERLSHLCEVFAIDICAYAVMSNHYHLVLHVDQQRSESWTYHEVIGRWARVFSCPPLVDRWQQGLCGEAESEVVESMIALWRARLCDVSWYMRCLNEHLARRANAEDQCTGRFWEGRFKSQALLDDAGLLTAMAYVDLNPVRAGIAPTPEASEFTSICDRIRALAGSDERPRVRLLAFGDAASKSCPCIPFVCRDYLELLDWTGRALRADRTGAINGKLPSILQRLNIDCTAWPQVMRPSGNVFGRAIGKLAHLRLHAQALGQSWIRGLRRAETLYSR